MPTNKPCPAKQGGRNSSENARGPGARSEKRLTRISEGEDAHVRRRNHEPRRIAAAHPNGLRRRLRVHDLRHTAASLMLASGMHMQEVPAELGHADATVTAKVYAHLLPAEVIRSSERYDAWLASEREQAADEAATSNVVPLRQA
jgi:integrase